ncbi:dehydrogenase [Bryobacterales bacterium F-183]|nr:dehydrogenase [Bryobacterales bacterium F-183]
MKIATKAPCRVDMAGGTLDIWPLYLFHSNSVVVNFAVDRYTSCILEPRADSEIHIASQDLKATDTYASLEALRTAKKHKLGLVAEVLKFFTPETGLNITTNSEAPAGAGISGSSSLLISTVSAFNKLCNTGYKIETVREIAQNIEARIIKVPTGCQDYYPAMYGGVSAIEMTPAGLIRKAIPVAIEDLESRVVLAYTGEPRNSGVNNWEVTKLHIDGDKNVQKNFAKIAAIANAMRAALEKSDWKEVSKLLRTEWEHRRTNAPGISTETIDHLITITRKAGSTAAKVCGAGGGGCVLFLVEPDAKQRVSDLIASQPGVSVLPVKVAPKGVEIKTSK